ncbi:MAG: GNAT family N-acetyltransferase [Mesobacillus sp.]|jgi:N-acetylglutamate synthase-like GNAT family acetyltransferase
MELNEVKLTKQMAKVFSIAEQECKQRESRCLMPEHLFLGCLDGGSYPIKEAIQKSGMDIDSLKNSCSHFHENLSLVICEPIKTPFCQSTKLVIDQAISYMRNYNQIFLNEGHVLKALIKSGHTDRVLTPEQQNTFLSLATVSRDMYLDLSGYCPQKQLYKNIRMVRNEDVERLNLFIKEEFGARWTETIKQAVERHLPSIYIAEDQSGDIIGFAAFDTHQPGYFGPMGVTKYKRARSIGESLLHVCLEGMLKKGYKEIIIHQAGPIEFYEKACNAKIIPLNE